MKKTTNQENKFIDIEKMALPKGGGAYKGMGENFDVNLFTGEGNLSIPIYTSPCRDYAPQLSLSYSTSSGNNIFGLGFSMSLPSITRKTSESIPKYDDTLDTFVLSSGGELILDESYINEEGFTVHSYYLRNEGAFSKIEYLKKDSLSYWKIVDRNNATSIFGRDPFSKIINPNDPSKVFAWLLSESIDDKGNKTKYSYEENNLIKTIQYGNYYVDDGEEEWGFSVQFQYRDRKDSFSRYNSGFLIETKMLCDCIQMHHHFEGNQELVRETRFIYEDDNRISLLGKISVTGYKEMNKGTIERLEMPDICFSYTKFQPSKGTFHVLEVENKIPFTLDKRGFSLVDLYGEGISGLLYASDKTVLYCRPLGNYMYGAPQSVEEFPIHKDFSRNEYSLMSLEGNGKYEFVVKTPTMNGFYELNEGKWTNFQPFQHYTNEQFHAYQETVDLQGDKLNHLMTTNEQNIRYYPSLKKEGVGQPITKTLPEGFPQVTQNSPTEVVTFLDIFGDGLSHRVRIRNGSVECWPNLGYGNFGEKVTMQNAPLLNEELDASRLFFADIDGSGVVDFIYAYPDRVDIYFNQCGKYFLEPISISLPEAFSKGDNISFGDINGTGTSCMVFSKLGYEVKHYCFDFTDGIKPYMLQAMNNNVGARTELQYKSSVELYLEDRKNHISWQLKPPFPVQLIVERKNIDEISRNVHVTNYRYKDGLYDFEERRFIGFGCIEQQERQYIENTAYQADTIQTKSWYYTGADAGKDYFCGDKEAMELEDHMFEATNLPEAKKSLYGQLLREEIYECHSKVPCSVKQSNYKVVELLAPKDKKRGSYFTQVSQSIHYTYEKDITDPVVHHEFILESDSYGNTLKSCEISYPRRKGFEQAAELARRQKTLHATVSINKYSNIIEQARYLGVPVEMKDFEARGIECENYFTFNVLKKELELAFSNEIPYGEEFADKRKQVRLIEWQRHFYWNNGMTEALPLGEVEGHLLLHHTEEAVFPKKFRILSNRFDEKILETDCGYEQKDGYWWNCGLTKYHYDGKKFYLPWKEEYQQIKTSLSYDKYCLMPIETVQCVAEGVENVTSAWIDYNALGYKQVTDVNENISQVIFDPLGQVVVTTSYGITDGKVEGNGDISDYVAQEATLEDVLSAPEKYVQNTTSYFYYDLLSYQKKKQPVHSISLQKQDFSSNNPQAKINCGVTYWDGFGRKSEEKWKADDVSWIVKNRTIYNSYSKEIMIYPSFYANNPYYEYMNIPLPPTIKHHDHLQRVIKVEKPKDGIAGEKYGYLYSKIEYGAWEQRIFDENSCMQDSDYYQEFMRTFPKNPTTEQADQKVALERTLAFDHHIKRSIFDGLGNKITDMLDEEEFVQYHFDMKGNVVEIADARLRKVEKHNLQYVYNMQGKTVYIDSCDAGEKLTLENIFGKVVHSINANGVHKKITYDSLLRPVETFVEGVGVVEKVEYGETVADCKNKNLKGQVYNYYDQAGVETNSIYTIINTVKEKSRRFCKQYKGAVDWSKDVEMEAEEFSESFTYDTAAHITLHIAPDHTEYQHTYDYLGQLKHVRSKNEKGNSHFVEDIHYNAEGQRIYILYGNDVTTHYRFNDVTSQLENVTSTKVSEGKLIPIQNLSYTYDPVGNLSRIRDNLGQTAYSNQQVTEPIWDYTYDKHHRLQRATGRELAGNKNDFENMVSYTQEYLYDLGGNMTQLRHASPVKSFTRKMGISDDSNRMQIVEHPGDNDGICENIAYDACGNIINLPNVQQMEWNHENQLVHATVIEREDGKNDEEYYVYNHSGNRQRKVTIRKIHDDRWEVTEKLYIGNYSVKRTTTETVDLYRTSMRITNGQTPIAIDYNWLKDEKGRETKETGTRKIHYQLENYLDCVSVELNEQADIISFEEYYPFGGTALIWINKSEVLLKEYRYCGKELDSATGLYYYGARYYSSAYGRMISSDGTEYVKLEDWQSINLFAYCENDPVGHVDPDGHAPIPYVSRKFKKYRDRATRIGTGIVISRKHNLIFLSKGILKSDIAYRTGEFKYLYHTDRIGRIDFFAAENLRLTKRKKRLLHVQRTLEKRATDDAGHIAGDRFGGSPKLDNLVSQDSHVNRSVFKSIEDNLAKAIRIKIPVSMYIKIKYPKISRRPRAFRVAWKIGKNLFYQKIKNG